MDRFASRPTPLALLGRLRANRLLRSNAIYLAGTVAAGAFGYVFHFVTGRLLGPAEYAIVASAVAALYLVTLPAQVVQIVSARFASLIAGRGELGEIRSLIRRLTLTSLGFGLPIAIGLAVFSGPVARYLQVRDLQVVWILAVASLGAVLIAVLRGVLLGLRRFVTIAVNGVVDMATRVVAVVALAGPLGALGGLIALVLGPAAAFAHATASLRGVGGRAAQQAVTMTEVGRYAGLTAVATVGTTYLYNADVILSKHYLVAASAGIYAAASVLGRVVYFLGLTVAQVMFPEVATLNARNQSHFHVVDQSLLLLLGVALTLVLAYAVAPGVVLLPYGPAFDPVQPYLWRFAIALGLLSIANLLINYFLSLGSGRFTVPLLAACALETLLIAIWHQGPEQVVEMLTISMLFLSGSLLSLYAVDRMRVRAVTP